MDQASQDLSPERLRAHERWLRRLARSVASPIATADDLAQETWLAALRARPDERGSLRPWLASVLRKLGAKQLRGTARAARRERAVARDEAQPSCVEALLELEQQEHLLRAVRALPEPHRRLILWRYYEERTPRQIADELGIAEGAARMRLHRALAELREQLGVRPAARSAPASITCGAWWMSTKTIGAAAAAVVLLSGAAWWVLASFPVASSSTEERAVSIAAADGSSSVSDTTSRAQGSVARSEAPAPDASEPEAERRARRIALPHLAVQVLDARERPRAAFPLAIGAAWGTALDEQVVHSEMQLSDAEGRVRFPEVAELAAALAARLSAESASRAPIDRSEPSFFVAPSGLALRAPRLAFDPRALSAEELRLVVPACGAVRLHLRGEPSQRRLRIEARALPRQTPASLRRWRVHPATSHAVEGDMLELRGVALDHVLHFTAHDVDGAAPEARLEAPGPSASDEVVDLELVLAEPYPAIVGELLSPHGQPIANATLSTRLRKESEGRLFRVGGVLVIDPPSPEGEHHTDARGRFRVPIDQELALAGSSTLELELRSGPPELHAFVGWSVAWRLPAEFAGGEHDAGTLVLEEAPLLVAGLVLDPHGKALADTRIVPLLPSTTETEATTTWSPIEALATSSDAHGRFELRGRLAVPRLRLRAQRVGYAAREEPELAQGTRDLRLVLDTARELTGSVRLPVGLPGEELEARLHRGGRFLAAQRLDRVGEFRFTELASTPLHLSLWSAHGHRELWSQSGAVPHLAEERDSRLHGIPLDAHWRAVPLRLFDERDEPFAGVSLEALPLDGEVRERLHAEVGADGRVILLVHATATRLYLEERQSSGLEIACRNDEQLVQLPGPIEVELELEAPALAALREERVGLDFALIRATQLALPPESVTRYAWVDEAGRARVRLPLAGTYRASWHGVETQGPVRAYRTQPDDASELLELAGGAARRVKLATPELLR
ncbi:MAG: sigma-70 family RNA polymerase sigma factor [Planctomycetes bacterium]|nr:sigma-70 family RNA polymerase sigma factor [Planctomycetota bacterium]